MFTNILNNLQLHIRTYNKLNKHALQNIEELYSNIKETLYSINQNKLKIAIEKEIENNFDKNNLSYITNENGINYYKYKIYNSKEFDIYDIKWEKFSSTQIHDHPDSGCFMYVYNGSLTEYSYSYNYKFINYDRYKHLNKYDFGFKKGKTDLHEIFANKYSESLHIYIPGQYKPTYFKRNYYENNFNDYPIYL
jgi:hypothetical protein